MDGRRPFRLTTYLALETSFKGGISAIGMLCMIAGGLGLSAMVSAKPIGRNGQMRAENDHNPAWPYGCPWLALEQMDRIRREVGRLSDALGWGPVETPWQAILSLPAVTLRSYGPPDDGGQTLLIVPAPIKRAYIWDLSPEVSVVRRCLGHGLRVYVMEWQQPGEGEQNLGLEDYAGRLILDCLKVVEKQTGQRQVLLAGHSLGGTLAAIFAAAHPERVKKLLLLGAPIHFGRDAGALRLLVNAAPRRLENALPGNVPGSFLDLAAWTAAPATFEAARWADLAASSLSPRRLQNHLRVHRWTLDELAMPRRLFGQLADWLYREDRFMRGTLHLEGKVLSPQRVRSALLSVAERCSAVVPSASILAFHDAASSHEKQLLWYEGDTGVAIQHVGMLVGARAHQHLWPRILVWLSTKAPRPAACR